MFRLRSSFAMLALALPVLVGARGCDEPGDPGTCYCAEIYAPVCGGDAITYGNECEADCAGVMIAHEGPCECPAIPAIWCEWGNVTDARGCPSPECNPPPPPPGCATDSDCAMDERCELPVCIWDDPSSPCPTEGYCVAPRCDA